MKLKKMPSLFSNESFEKQKGVTLIELMIAAGFVSFMTLTVSIFMVSIAKMSKNALLSDDINRDLENAIAMLQNLTFYAVNTRYVNTAALGAAGLDGRMTSGNGQGLVRNINIDQQSDMNGKPSTTLMYFWRENARSRANASTLQSNYAPTAVFYRAKVETAAVRRPPALVIHPGRNALGTGVLSVNDSDVISFDYISDVQLDQPQVLNTAENLHILSSIRITLHAIYPLASQAGSSLQQNDCFGPSRDVESGITCQNTKPFKIVQKAATLYFPNNKRHTFNPNHEFSDGIYFFRPTLLSGP